jgi:hypothetical protein
LYKVYVVYKFREVAPKVKEEKERLDGYIKNKFIEYGLVPDVYEQPCA